MNSAMPRQFSMYLDVVRFLAALLVFLGHASTAYMTGGLFWQLAPYGDTCVVVFFVLSGYVIGYVVDTKDLQWQSYVANRSARLWSVVLPALLLTAMVDLIGVRIAPAIYDGPWFQSDNLALRYLASALMLQEVWHVWLVPGINGPFWSLTYEAFYYAVFGALIFIRPRTKWIAGAALLAAGGPLIAALFPIWALGYLAYRSAKKLSLPAPLNAILFCTGLAFLWFSPAIRAALHVDLPIMGDPLLGRYIDALAIFLNLMGAHGLSRSTLPISQRLYRALSRIAGSTFALYLFHRPLIQFFSYVGPHDPSSWQRRALLIGGTLLLTFIAVPLTESLRRSLAALILRVLPRKIPPPAAIGNTPPTDHKTVHGILASAANSSSPPWAVAIFTARESIETLGDCIQAAISACQGRFFTIDVLVNGNHKLAQQTAEVISKIQAIGPSDAVRVWYIPLGDKAHAWNEYVHQICPQGATAFFIDGYAEVNTDALALLATALDNTPDALGASGVPTCGRSAKTLRDSMIKNGGIHGNLFALSHHAMSELQACKFRLPLGLYRIDSFIGAVMMFRFAPTKFGWDTCRIVVHPHASWVVKQNRLWSLAKLTAQLKRLFRQAQGELENHAAREHLSIKQLAPETMQRTVNGFVNEWINAQPVQAKHLFWTQPLTYLAARRMRQEKNWSTATIPAQLLAVNNEPTSSKDALLAK